MGFLKVVEVFPPMYRKGSSTHVDLELKLDELVGKVREIRGVADVILVANHKDPELVKYSSVDAAIALKERGGVDASPVLVARDLDRAQIAKSVAACLARGITTLALMWGDRYGPGQPKNVYDYPALSAMIADVRAIANDAGKELRILAPIDLRKMGKSGDLASSRLEAGADFLLAQPPTTDWGPTYEEHFKLLEKSGLKDKVLLDLFPFKDLADIERIEKLFGWTISHSLKDVARSGTLDPVKQLKEVASRIRENGLPGVYLETRGNPLMARDVLSS